MKVSQIKIENILGIEEFSIEPGKITILHGKNAVGKTSFLTALQKVFDGGSLVEVKNIDSDEEPEIAVRIEGDEGAYLVGKTEKKTTVKKQIEQSAAFKPVKAPQRFLKSLVDSKTNNPISFVSARNKDQVDMLLGAADLDFDRDKMWSLMGLKRNRMPALPDGAHPITEIDMTREMVYNERRGVNVELRQKKDSIEQILRNIPATTEPIPDVGALMRERENKIVEYEEIKAAVVEARKEIVNEIQTNRRDKISELKAQQQQKEEEIMAEANRQIRIMAEGIDSQILTINTECDEATKRAYSSADTDMQTANEIQPILDDLASQISSANHLRDNISRINANRKLADQFASEAEGLDARSAQMTDAIKAIDNYKKQLLEKLPIDGLTIEGDTILINGIPWETINTAKQMEIATMVACARAQKCALPIIWIDGAESLDADSFESMRRIIEDSNVQAIICRVSDEPLRVEKQG